LEHLDEEVSRWTRRAEPPCDEGNLDHPSGRSCGVPRDATDHGAIGKVGIRKLAHECPHQTARARMIRAPRQVDPTAEEFLNSPTTPCVTLGQT
jgi:hypothetical protein